MKNITLLGDRVIVKHHGFEEEEHNGWKNFDTDHEKARKGKVLAVGPGINGLDMTIKVGDTVLYGKDAGIELTVENQKVLIMRESDIYTSIRNEKTN